MQQIKNLVRIPITKYSAAALILFAGVAFALSPLFLLLHVKWTTVGLYSHGYLLVAVVTWIIWRNIKQCKLLILNPSWLFVAILIVAMLYVWILDYLFINVPRLFALPIIVWASLSLVFGRAIARLSAAPLALFYLALPVWEWLYPPLTSLSTLSAGTLLALSNVPAFIHGNSVELPSGQFEIIDGCSGLNFLIVSATLSSAFGLAYLESWRSRAYLFVVAIVITLFANWLRIYTIIVAGHISDMQHYLIQVEHTNFGWALYSVFAVLIVWFGVFLERKGHIDVVLPGSTRVAGQASSGSVYAAIVAVLLLQIPNIIVPPSNLRSDRFDYIQWDVPSRFGNLELPKLNQVRDNWTPVMSGAHENTTSYGDEQNILDVYWGVYPRQTKDKRILLYANRNFSEGWRLVGTSKRKQSGTGNVPTPLELELVKGREKRIVWLWYVVGDAAANSKPAVLLLEIRNIISLRRVSGVIAISMRCDEACDTAREVMISTVRNNSPTLYWPVLNLSAEE